MKFSIAKDNMNDKKVLRIINLGGTETVTKNLTVYEYDDEIIAVDCGVYFPDSEMHGVDVVIPDFTYLEENSHKFKALFITHGHEDHFGAVPYFLDRFDVPIYADKLVQGFLRERFKDKDSKKYAEKVRFVDFESSTPEVHLKHFKVSAFGVNHSVPDSKGLAIRTPEGLVLHIADFKVDWTPVIDPPIEIDKIANFGNEGVLCLLSDCLGVTKEGMSASEVTIEPTFLDLFEKAKGRQLMITTISSNLSRMYQIIKTAEHYGRKVVLGGRSIQQSVSVAQNLGYLPFPDDLFVSEKSAQSQNQGNIVYIIAGCYGQVGSALERVSRDENERIYLEDNAMIVFSADPNPPGTDVMVEKVMDRLTLKGAEVVYSDIQDNLHISGHGTKGDLTLIAQLAKPKYFIPIGGTITKMRAYRNMLVELGIEKERVFENLEGESVEFSNGEATVGSTIKTELVMIGSDTGEISPIVMKDREQLSSEGVFVVVVPRDKNGNLVPEKSEIITRGFIYVKESPELMQQYRDFAAKSINKWLDKDKDWNELKRKVELDFEKYLYKKSRRRPMVLVHSI
ncbi:ribonuclease J [Patescibacteria group bacterium]|nr:ribonuclease J [Patescibacteria group bacterium]